MRVAHNAAHRRLKRYASVIECRGRPAFAAPHLMMKGRTADGDQNNLTEDRTTLLAERRQADEEERENALAKVSSVAADSPFRGVVLPLPSRSSAKRTAPTSAHRRHNFQTHVVGKVGLLRRASPAPCSARSF